METRVFTLGDDYLIVGPEIEEKYIERVTVKKTQLPKSALSFELDYRKRKPDDVLISQARYFLLNVNHPSKAKLVTSDYFNGRRGVVRYTLQFLYDIWDGKRDDNKRVEMRKLLACKKVIGVGIESVDLRKKGEKEARVKLEAVIEALEVGIRKRFNISQ